MQNNYFNSYLNNMRAYIKTLRLVFKGHNGWSELDRLPHNYHIIAGKLRVLMDSEYKTLSDLEWAERIIYYKQMQDKFDADHRQEGHDYCVALLAKHRESMNEYIIANEQAEIMINGGQKEEVENYFREVSAKKEWDKRLYRQNQSYMDALIRTRQYIDTLVNTTLSPAYKKLQKTEKLPLKIEDNLSKCYLSIVPGAKQALYVGLCKYIDMQDHKALSDLIFKEIAPPSKIKLDCLVKEFALTFVNARAVRNNGADALSKELPYVFQRRSSKGLESLSSNSLVKLLRNKSLLV